MMPAYWWTLLSINKFYLNERDEYLLSFSHDEYFVLHKTIFQPSSMLRKDISDRLYSAISVQLK